MTAPLAGVRVVEVGNFLAAPFCAMQLADLGAEVIKVERPDGGDVVRASSPFVEGESSTFVRLNRNKRSVTIDLKHPSGKGLFTRLLSTADVLIENLSPGSMRGLGLGYEDVNEANPGLIYLSVSGWGQDGPYAQLSGLDIIAQAMSGLMSITGEEGRGPVKVGVPVTDLTCGIYGALAVTAALFSRVTTGLGQYLDVSLFESGVSLGVWEAGEYFATGTVHGRLGTAHQRTAPYQAVEAADGRFCVGATTPATWPAFCRVLGRAEWIDLPEYATSSLRHAARDRLIPDIEAVTRTRPMSHWIDACQKAGIPVGAIHDFPEVFNDPHLIERGFFADAPHETIGSVRQMSSPMHLSRTPTRMDSAGPLLGQHTRDVLLEIGCSALEIEGLCEEGVVTVR